MRSNVFDGSPLYLINNQIFEFDELIVWPPALFNPKVNVPFELVNDEKSPTTSTESLNGLLSPLDCEFKEPP